MNIILSTQNLHKIATSNCGWNRQQLEILGIKYPPRKGWLRRLVGTEITEEQYQKLLKLRRPGKEERAQGFLINSFGQSVYCKKLVTPYPPRVAETRKPSQDDLILEKLDEILANQQKFADALSGQGPVSPELEAQILKSRALSTKIDRKVPDQKKA